MHNELTFRVTLQVLRRKVYSIFVEVDCVFLQLDLQMEGNKFTLQCQRTTLG